MMLPTKQQGLKRTCVLMEKMLVFCKFFFNFQLFFAQGPSNQKFFDIDFIEF